MIEHPAHLLTEPVARHWTAEHEAAQPGKAKGGRHRWWAMSAIAPAVLISAFDMTTLNVALPALTKALRATTSDLQWIIDSYAIVLAGLLLFAQGVGDRFGRKGVYLSGLALFGLASASAAFATTPARLILARAIMSIGAALLLSPTLAMIAVIFSPDERPRAVAIWVICGGIGIALGPVLGGLIVDSFGWGGVFLINVPVVIAAGLAILALIDGVASYGVTLLGTMVLGAGVGISVGPATTVVVNALPVEKAGDGSSVNLLMRQSGAAFGVAIIGSVFASAYAAEIASALRGFGPDQAEVIRRSIQGAETVATGLASPHGAALLAAADRAFLGAARDGLLVSSALAALGAVIAALALRRGGRSDRS